MIGDEAVARCPYHNDGHPSFSVNTKKALFRCFSCGAKGNITKLLHDFLGYSYAEATIYVNETLGFSRMDKWREDYQSLSFDPPPLKVTEADMALFTDPPAIMLKEKNITLSAARHYNILWNPANESWIFPYRDPYTYDLWGWQEKNRRMFRNFPAGTKRGRTLFGIEKRYERVVLLESAMDCAVAHNASGGFLPAVASFGLPSLYQLNLLRERTDNITLALDNDKQGRKATAELIPEALKIFLNVRVLEYTGQETTKDIGEMVTEYVYERFEKAAPALQWLREYKEEK